ncbi:pilus assembly protein [Parasedimentitalea maritima]|uniref:Pilus assembly protein n=1 Tax=Parasedimentitalea maritima TaxID=2578117 RepID=A0A5R8ZP15_9RHOB|nr:TadE family protein [Zongyanglinia marina]KAE9627910.1 pilus assembly protein [Zongyanglinia marina]TLP67024.1 pilus assembly protein [Zongyanglinia marina]
MITRIQNSIRNFRSREDGSSSVEFALVIPAFIIILLSTVELGLITIRQTMLERAMDQTVRDLRLGTGTGQTHDGIRNSICERSGFIDDCGTSLRLEMVQVDPFNWGNINEVPDCIDQAEVVLPVREFTNGQSNELMFIRACMKFEPIFPFWGLGNSLHKDGEGRVSLFASSAFVQEPR